MQLFSVDLNTALTSEVFNSLTATRFSEQMSVIFCTPIPVKPSLSKGLIKRAALELRRFNQRTNGTKKYSLVIHNHILFQKHTISMNKRAVMRINLCTVKALLVPTFYGQTSSFL